MKFLLTLTLLLAYLFVPAQVPVNASEDIDLIFSRNHFSVSVMGGMTLRSDVSAQPQMYQLGSSNRLAFGGGINYHCNFSRRLSLITGLQMVAPIRNIEYYISKDQFDPPFSFDVFHNGSISEAVVFVLRIPVTLQARWFYGKRTLWYAEAGASLNYTGSSEEGEEHWLVDDNNQPVRYFNMILYHNNNNRPWLNYHLGSGHGWLLGNKDLITCGFIVNLSFTSFVHGPFSMEIPNQPVVIGNYGFKGSYIGLTGNYIFTGAKKRMRQWR